MKVALVCDWYHPRVGGIELHLHDLAHQLTACGHEVVVITPTPGAAEVDGIRVRRIDAPRAPRFGFIYTPAGVRAVGQALHDERADVAHCHVSIISPTALGGARYAERAGVATALTFHSVVPQTRLLARAMNALIRVSTWRASFSAVSARVARDVQPLAGRNEIVVLPNGIDAAFWRSGPATPMRGPEQPVRLISVMRLNAKKRPHALVRLMARLRARELDVHLNVIGDGPERGRLERAIAHAKLQDRIVLLGTRTRIEIRDAFAGADIFVLPTIRESFGLAALEARCAGLPVVAMAQSGVSELIEHGRNGLLARTDAELATHVAALTLNDEDRAALAQRNRAELPPFDWERTIDAHLALYRDAIALRRSV